MHLLVSENVMIPYFKWRVASPLIVVLALDLFPIGQSEKKIHHLNLVSVAMGDSFDLRRF